MHPKPLDERSESRGFHPRRAYASTLAMQVTVNYLAQIKRAAGVSVETVDLDPGATLAALCARLRGRHDEAFAAMLSQKAMLFFVNDEHAASDRTLADGDEVSILAPMAGGTFSV